MAEIPLTKGAVAIVDEDDYERLIAMGTWCYDGHGYAVRNHQYETGRKGHLQMHRVINNTPAGKLTDHINGNRLDNRKNNLRSVDCKENALNKIGHRDESYKGYYKTRHGKYCVRFCNKRIGTFDSEELAYQVYTMLLSGELPVLPLLQSKGYQEKRGKYQVRFGSGEYRTTIGVFDTADEAHSVYTNIKEQLEKS